eukprot:319075-Hanusia_phi.AAC.1
MAIGPAREDWTGGGEEWAFHDRRRRRMGISRQEEKENGHFTTGGEGEWAFHDRRRRRRTGTEAFFL